MLPEYKNDNGSKFLENRSSHRKIYTFKYIFQYISMLSQRHIPLWHADMGLTQVNSINYIYMPYNIYKARKKYTYTPMNLTHVVDTSVKAQYYTHLFMYICILIPFQMNILSMKMYTYVHVHTYKSICAQQVATVMTTNIFIFIILFCFVSLYFSFPSHRPIMMLLMR